MFRPAGLTKTKPQKPITLMKTTLLTLTLVLVSLFGPGSLFASPETEKAFLDTYKKAYESSDGKTLEGFLYVKEADPTALQFYKMMITAEMGGKISSITLEELTADDVKDAGKIQDLPGGQKAKLPLKPTKKLVIKTETGDGDNKSTSTSSCYVAEVDGKLVILVPAAVK
jgi:hypothetical protein